MKELKNAAQFKEILNSNKPILLDFYADWCGPCQTQLPIVENLADLHKDDFTIAKVNVDINKELAQQFQVRSIPALFIIKDGEIKEKFNGLQTKDLLDNVINKYVA